MTAPATLPTTAPALVVIDKDAVLVEIRQTAAALLERARTFVITPNNRAEASAFLVDVANAKRRLEDRRKEITSPHTSYERKVNAFVRDIGAPVVEADGLMRDKLRTFIREEEQLQARLQAEARQRELEAQALAEQALKAEQEGKGAVADRLLDEAVAAESRATAAGQFAAATPPLARTVKTDVGTVSTRKVWTFEVTNLEKVPREYLKVEINGTAVRAAIAGGLRDAPDGTPAIPGVRIFEDDQVSVRG